MNEPRKPKLTREEIAQIEVGHTDISPRTALVMMLVFLVLIAAVPLTEIIGQWRSGVAAFDLIRRPPRVEEFVFPLHREAQVEVNRLHEAERGIEDASWLRTSIQPQVQQRLTSWFHLGNTKVVLGSDDWLFYRPGIDYTAGLGFLNHDQKLVLPRMHADARPAILAFHKALAESGIRLILMPMPDKAMIHSERMSRSLSGAALDNVDYPAFLDQMAQAGIEVWRPLDLLMSLKQSAGEVYLRQDTHWTPETMDAVAAALAKHLLPTSSAVTSPWHTVAMPASRVGDLVDTLKLPAHQTIYQPQSVVVQQVRDAEDRPWSASSTANILLLGDSFANIYSEPRMGWGEAAGFAPHLALHLGQPIDVIAVNGGGAHATRRALADELGRGKDRLAGKQVLVWEFAIRELAVGDWPVIPIVRQAAAPPATGFVPESGETIELTATVAAVSAAPRPGSVPYRDHLVSARLTDLRGTDPRLAGKQLRTYVWSMRDNVWTNAARWRPGEQVHLRVQPWDDVADDLERLNRAELDEPAAATLSPCFAVPVP